jgi:hypothetical protein
MSDYLSGKFEDTYTSKVYRNPKGIHTIVLYGENDLERHFIGDCSGWTEISTDDTPLYESPDTAAGRELDIILASHVRFQDIETREEFLIEDHQLKTEIAELR